MINEYFFNDVMRALVLMSISGGIVAVLLFALKPLVRNRLPKTTQYYSWLVVIAALLIPVSIFVKLPAATDTAPTIISPGNVVDRYFITGEEEMDRMGALDDFGSREVSNQNYMQAANEAKSPVPVMTAFTFFTISYPIGVLFVLLYYIVNYSVFVRLYRRRNNSATTDEKALLSELCEGKRKHAPLLYRNPFAATPMLIGLFRPTIILPKKEYNDAQLRAVLLHELTHLRRKDVFVKWLTVLVTAAHWFNPIVWFVKSEINRACELACDEAVIAGFDANGKQDYGETLIYVAADSKTPHAVLSTTMCEEKKALKERLGSIMKNKKHTRLAIILSVALILAAGGTAIALGAGRADKLIEMKIDYVDNPAYFLKDMQLSWDDTIYNATPMLNAERGKEIGYATDELSTWRIFEIKGYGQDYLLAVESEDVWRVMSSITPEAPYKQYILENATEQQRMERMLSVTLYNDGTARLATPLISSHLIVYPLYYTFENDELNNENNELKIHYESGAVVAIFDVIDDNTIIFKSATEQLFADSGARYVNAPASVVPPETEPLLADSETGYENAPALVVPSVTESLFADSEAGYENAPALVVPPTTFQSRKWIDTENNEYSLTSTHDLMLDEFPGVVFSYTPERLTATYDNREIELFGGTDGFIFGGYIDSVYLTDLNGDGKPEFCSTTNFGSGFGDMRIIIYDYANDKRYVLSDRGTYDYYLQMENGQLEVVQTGPMQMSEMPLGTGRLAIINGELVTFGIDRKLPELEQHPQTSAPPRDADANSTLYEGFYQIVMKLFSIDSALNEDINYIAVDMSEVIESEREMLERTLRSWTSSLGYRLLLMNTDELADAGYMTLEPIETAGFPDGVLFTFEEASFEGDVLIAKAVKYRSPRGSVGAEFKARFVEGNWIVEEPEAVWMS